MELCFASWLPTDPATVFRVIRTMEGVNRELRPWIRMTFPPRHATLLDEESQGVSFASWLLALGVVPFDRHRLTLERIYQGPEVYGFDEESTSWLQRRWRHERRVVAAPGGCEVIDRLVVVPRVGVVAPIVRRIVQALFEHRHRVLRRHHR